MDENSIVLRILKSKLNKYPYTSHIYSIIKELYSELEMVHSCTNCNELFETFEPPEDGNYECDECRKELKYTFNN